MDSPNSMATDRRWHGLPLCAWTTDGHLCPQVCETNHDLCAWHREWIRRTDTTGSPYAHFLGWQSQFGPGGAYESNPGQWRGNPADLWYRLTGQVIHQGGQP